LLSIIQAAGTPGERAVGLATVFDRQ
jgi:hypothetical protein